MTAPAPGPPAQAAPSPSPLPPHAITQTWARTITAAFPDLEGLRYNSRFAGDPCLALFPPATSAMPARPTTALPLDHPDLTHRIAGAAKRLGYTVI